MPVYHIKQTPALQGEVEIDVAKNAVLPILAASLLCSSPVTIRRVPRFTDIDSMLSVLAACGAAIERENDNVTIRAMALHIPDDPAPFHLLRASILVLGPLCARLQEAVVPLPGGCAIGQRPIDIHLKGLRAMGVDARLENNQVLAQGQTKCASIYLDFPSVGATENLLMEGVKRGGDRQKLHEVIRTCSMEATAQMKSGGECDLLERLARSESFGLTLDEMESLLNPALYIGRSEGQVKAYLEKVDPLIATAERRVAKINL